MKAKGGRRVAGDFRQYLEDKWKTYVKEKRLRNCTEQIAKQKYSGYIRKATLGFEVPILRKGKTVQLSAKPK